MEDAEYEATRLAYHKAAGDLMDAARLRAATIVAGLFPEATALRCVGWINDDSIPILRPAQVLNGGRVIGEAGSLDITVEALDWLAELGGDDYLWCVIDLAVPSGEITWLAKESPEAQVVIKTYGWL